MATAAEVMGGERMTKARAEMLTEPGRYPEGTVSGLYLRVASPTSKQWVQRIWVDGVRVDKGLGAFPRVGIAEARQMAERNRTLVRAGTNPWAAKRAAQGASQDATKERKARAGMPTFLEVAKLTDAALAMKRKPGAKKTGKWLRSLDMHAKALHNIPLDRITREDVIGALEPIWTSHADTAQGVFYRIRQVLAYGIEDGLLTQNVAAGQFNFRLPRQPKLQRGHQRSIPWHDAPGVLAKVRASTAADVTKRAMEFVVLTAGRSAQVREATWDEMDLGAATWTIPADRMKGTKGKARTHVAPLSQQAVALLNAQAASGVNSEYVFASTGGGALSDNTLTALLRRIDVDSTTHGFRATFGEWTDETGEDHRMAELCLAHTVGGMVEAAYFRSDVIGRRRDLLQRWADYVTSG